MENTSENKARFFAQYYGLKINTFKLYRTSPRRTLAYLGGPAYGYLELKPMSDISDEDLTCIGFVFPTGKRDGVEFDFCFTSYICHWTAKKDGQVKEGFLKLSDFDYLRFSGYAIPYLDLSVQDLIDMGWIKLKS